LGTAKGNDLVHLIEVSGKKRGLCVHRGTFISYIGAFDTAPLPLMGAWQP